MTTNPSVLVIEDDTSIRELLRLHLSAQGYAVDTASDAAEALGKLTKRRPDLVLSDLNIPYMDGLDCPSGAQGRRADTLAAGGHPVRAPR